MEAANVRNRHRSISAQSPRPLELSRASFDFERLHRYIHEEA
jgi:hypothetical protein